jgi:hypothetical protein
MATRSACSQAETVSTLRERNAGLRLACGQCGRPLPDDEGEIARWRYGRLAAAGELDETSAPILLCPECTEDAVSGAYEPGGGD